MAPLVPGPCSWGRTPPPRSHPSPQKRPPALAPGASTSPHLPRIRYCQQFNAGASSPSLLLTCFFPTYNKVPVGDIPEPTSQLFQLQLFYLHPKRESQRYRRAVCLHAEGTLRPPLGWLHLKPLTKASRQAYPSLVSLATETQPRETPSFKLSGKRLQKIYTPMGKSLFFRDLIRHCFKLGGINFVIPFLPLQYTEIPCLGRFS